jgi:hypothetical protein
MVWIVNVRSTVPQWPGPQSSQAKNEARTQLNPGYRSKAAALMI